MYPLPGEVFPNSVDGVDVYVVYSKRLLKKYGRYIGQQDLAELTGQELCSHLSIQLQEDCTDHLCEDAVGVVVSRFIVDIINGLRVLA